MIEVVLWLAGGAFVVLAVLITYAAWSGMLDEDDKLRRDEKHRNHYKWGHYKGRKQ